MNWFWPFWILSWIKRPQRCLRTRLCHDLRTGNDSKRSENRIFSKCYTNSQKNYSTSEKEILGIVMVEHWSFYLYGKKIIIYSDHKPLAWLLNKKYPHPKQERWIIRLPIYEFEIRYKPARGNVVAEMLSRLFEENDVNENSEDD